MIRVRRAAKYRHSFTSYTPEHFCRLILTFADPHDDRKWSPFRTLFNLPPFVCEKPRGSGRAPLADTGAHDPNPIWKLSRTDFKNQAVVKSRVKNQAIGNFRAHDQADDAVTPTILPSKVCANHGNMQMILAA